MKDVVWTNQDAVALRDFFRRVSPEKLSQVLLSGKPVITQDILLKNDADAISRLAAMEAGWVEAVRVFFALAEKNSSSEPSSDYKSMT